MNLYKSHSNRELVAVLENVDKLTYEAQLNLKHEIDKRELIIDTKDLNSSLQKIEKDIENLDYLKDLGFYAAYNLQEGYLKVYRHKKAQLMDAVSVIIGGILFFIGLVHLWLLLAMFFGDNEFTLTKLITYCSVLLGGIIGLKMLSGIHRFLDYRNFLLEQHHNELKLVMSNDSSTFSANDASLLTIDDDYIFSLKEDYIIYASESNLIQRKTLEALVRKIKSLG